MPWRYRVLAWLTYLITSWFVYVWASRERDGRLSRAYGTLFWGIICALIILWLAIFHPSYLTGK